MVAVFSLFVVLIVSMMIVRIATVALVQTGLSLQLARFQARSAFTGSGFTTAESEQVVRHPVRRRIIMLLMLLGNAGIVTVISSLFLSFTTTDEGGSLTGHTWFRVVVMIVGLATLWVVAHSQWIDRHVTRIVAWALKKWTDLDVRDYAGLLHLTGDYVVAELGVEKDDWLSNRSLAELRLSDEGVLVLGVEKSDGKYIGAPRGQTMLEADDILLLYARQDVLADLDDRRTGASGNWDHVKAVEKQMKLEAEAEEEMQAEAESDW